MRLHEVSWGIYPRRVSIYLAEKGVAIERVPVADGENRRPAFLRLSPVGTLPVLEVEPGVAVGQSTAILEYLEETCPGPDLIGATAMERAQTRDFVSLINEAYIAFALYAANRSRIFVGRYPQDAAVGAAMRDRYELLLSQIDAVIGSGPFLCGERVTIADCSLFASAQFASLFYRSPVPLSCPKLSAFYDMFSGRPSAAPPEYPAHLAALAPLP